MQIMRHEHYSFETIALEINQDFDHLVSLLLLLKIRNEKERKKITVFRFKSKFRNLCKKWMTMVIFC